MTLRFAELLLLMALLQCASPVKGHELPAVDVVGHYDNSLGSSDAASQGAMGAELLRNRALLRPAEVLEFIPGMVVTQHSGDGKANQYFLRGMNLDHGTDFATWVNGVPVNLPTHAHGQGYSDLNFLIPELMARVDYRKGPYFASEGDFSSAGSAHISYRTRLERPLLVTTLGQGGHWRSLVAGSQALSEGVTLLTALERLNHDGPWAVPQGMRKNNALLTLSGGSARSGWSGSLSFYEAHWRSTDQVPRRLIDAGRYLEQPFGRFDSLDPTNGARTRRTTLSASWHQRSDQALQRVSVYAVGYGLDLFSNFTYRLESDRASDQFAQNDRRTVLGGQASRTWWSQLGSGQTLQNTLGLQWRQDRIRAGLYDSVAGQIQTAVRDDSVRQSQLGVYGENEIGWTPWLRSVAGLRVDRLDTRVHSHMQPDNSGNANALRFSPKLSLIFGPWARTEFFINAGRGFHSNDARGTTARVDPRTGEALSPVFGLTGSRGQEIGLKSVILPGVQTTLALWRLDFDSELVYVGDAGNTAAGRASRRTGIEWTSHWSPVGYLRLDTSLAWTRPLFLDGDPKQRFIPNAVQQVAQVGVSLSRRGPWAASLNWRYVGPAPLTEDNTVRSLASQTLQLRIQRQIGSHLDMALDVFNLGNRRNNDIAYHYVSRLVNEPAAGVADVHVHPAELRTARLTARIRF